MKHSNSNPRGNPLGLDRITMRDCSIYKKMPDGTFYPWFWNDVKRTKKGTTFLISQNPRDGKICLMTRTEVKKLLKLEDDYNAEIEKRRYKISR